MRWGDFGFKCWRVRGITIVSFLFYVNVYRMETLTIPVPRVFLRVGWPIPLVPP